MAGNSGSSSLNQVLPETTSRCLSQNITGAHNFVVTNFSELDGMGIGQYVSSGTRIKVSLSLFGKYDDQAISIQKGKKKRNGKKVLEFAHGVRTMEPGTGWGWSKFIKKSSLREYIQHV
ncbi:hypothetical protein EJB05_39682, partial [Eragrostis curvula]